MPQSRKREAEPFFKALSALAERVEERPSRVGKNKYRRPCDSPSLHLGALNIRKILCTYDREVHGKIAYLLVPGLTARAIQLAETLDGGKNGAWYNTLRAEIDKFLQAVDPDEDTDAVEDKIIPLLCRFVINMMTPGIFVYQKGIKALELQEYADQLHFAMDDTATDDPKKQEQQKAEAEAVANAEAEAEAARFAVDAAEKLSPLEAAEAAHKEAEEAEAAEAAAEAAHKEAEEAEAAEAAAEAKATEDWMAGVCAEECVTPKDG
jgi:hypothetical protein